MRVQSFVRVAVAIAVAGAAVTSAAAGPAAAWTLPTQLVDLSSAPHDIVLDESRDRVYVSLPSENVVVALAADDLDEEARWPVGSRPVGMDLLADGERLAVALNGGGAVAFLDLDTGAVTTRALATELGDSRTWDVAEVQPGRLLVTANPSSNGFAWVVQLLLGTDTASRVAGDRIIRAAPRITVNSTATFAFVGEGFSPESIYKLDLAQATAPIVAEDAHGSVGGTHQMVVTADDGFVQTTAGLLVRTSDITVGGTVAGGSPVAQPDPAVVWVLNQGRLQSFSATTQVRLGSVGLACPLSVQANALDPVADRLWVIGGTRVCATDLGATPFAPRTTADPAGDAPGGIDVRVVRESATASRVVYAVRAGASFPRDHGIFFGFDLNVDRDQLEAFLAVDPSGGAASFFCGQSGQPTPVDYVRVDAVEVRVGLPRSLLSGCGLPQPLFEYGVFTGPFDSDVVHDEVPAEILLVGTIGIVHDLDAANPTTNFVRALFRDFLGRAPDAAGSDFWTYRSDLGPSRQGVAVQFAASDEWIGVTVDQLYLTTLGRLPDAAGRNHWIGRIRAGLSVARAGGFFYGSDEYFQSAGGTVEDWIIRLYEDVLGRTPDQTGLDFWVGRHASGVPRYAIGEGFFQSVESRRQRVTALYQKLLGRGTDPAGLAFWADQILVHGDLSLAASLAGSPEYYDRAQRR